MWDQSCAATWPSPLATYSSSPFLCSPRWSHSHRHRRRALSVPFRRTLDRWSSRTRGAVRCNRHSIGRSGSRGAWSLHLSACRGLRIASQLVLGLRADQHNIVMIQGVVWLAHFCHGHWPLSSSDRRYVRYGNCTHCRGKVRHWICHEIKYDLHSSCAAWQLELRDERKFRVYECRVLRIFEPKR